MMKRTLSCGGVRTSLACVVVMSLAGLLPVQAYAGMDEQSGVCPIPEARHSGMTTGAYCPRGATYCAGFVLFCCFTGEAIGPCIGAWGCRWGDNGITTAPRQSMITAEDLERPPMELEWNFGEPRWGVEKEREQSLFRGLEHDASQQCS